MKLWNSAIVKKFKIKITSNFYKFENRIQDSSQDIICSFVITKKCIGYFIEFRKLNVEKIGYFNWFEINNSLLLLQKVSIIH